MTDCAVPVVLSPEPFSRRTEYAKAPAGRTICAVLAEAVDAGQLSLDDLVRTSIYVDGARLDHDAALDHVVAEGEIVNVVVEPLGGGGRGGKDVGQILLTIAIVAVSAWVSGGGLAAWGLEAGKLATRVAAASVMVLGQAATAALFAPDAASAAKANDRYALQSASNQFRQWAPFPLALGEVAVAPDLAVKTYTQTVGDESWIYGILGLHYGPCQVADLKIGDTLFSDMGANDVRIAQHLTPGPRTFSIVANDIDQTDLQEELTATTGSATAVVRAAGAEGERFDFDFFLPAGLYFAKDDGRKEPASVTVTIRSRPIDSNGNPTGGGAWSNALTIPLTGSSSDPMRITRSVNLPLNRYQFEVKRSVLVDSSAKRHTDIAWTAVRAIAFRKPITDETLSIIEFAVRATALNQGALAPITCRITPLAQTWTGTTWGPAVPTSNPAALTRWLMTGPAPSRPLTSAQADVGLRAWSALCDTYDWKAHLYLTGDDRQDAAMKMLGHAGRAGVFWDGTQLVAATWAEKPAPRQMFAGGNLKDHRWTIVYPDEVHALRVEFQNLDEGGEPDELYVYADGYAETAGAGLTAATLIEALRLDGQMTLERAYRNGRWALGARIHQRRIDTWSTNMEHLACRYGDRVRLAWDRVSGVDCRVRCRRWSGSLVSGLRLSQPVTFTPGETYAADLRLSDQTLAAVPIVNPATTADVVTREITFGSPRAAALSPAGGDLIAFGLTERVSEDVEVLGMEPGPGLTANLTGMRYVAPLLMAGETGPIPPLQTRLTRDRFRDPPMPTLLGAVLDDTVLRISFSMPPWRGSPLTGFAARWRQAPAAGQTIGWTDLPDLPAGAMALTTPTLRELPSTDDLTKVEIQITAMTASGRVSEPLSVTVTVATVATPSAGEWTVTIRPADPNGEQQPGLLVTGAVDATRVATVRIAYGTSSTGPWQEVYAGPPTAQAVPINGLSPNVDYWVVISYFSAQGVPSGFLVKGPYTAPGLIAGGVGDHTAADVLELFEQMEAIGDGVVADAFERFNDEREAAATAIFRNARGSHDLQVRRDAEKWINGQRFGPYVQQGFETLTDGQNQLAGYLALLGVRSPDGLAWLLRADTVQLFEGEFLIDSLLRMQARTEASFAYADEKWELTAGPTEAMARFLMLAGVEMAGGTAFRLSETNLYVGGRGPLGEVLDSLVVTIGEDSSGVIDLIRAVLEEDGGLAERIGVVEVDYGDVDVRVTTIESALAEGGSGEAVWGFLLDVNGYPSGLRQTNTGLVSALKILSDQVVFVTSDGEQVLLDIDDDEILLNTNVRINGLLNLLDASVTWPKIAPNSATRFFNAFSASALNMSPGLWNPVQSVSVPGVTAGKRVMVEPSMDLSFWHPAGGDFGSINMKIIRTKDDGMGGVETDIWTFTPDTPNGDEYRDWIAPKVPDTTHGGGDLVYTFAIQFSNTSFDYTRARSRSLTATEHLL